MQDQKFVCNNCKYDSPDSGYCPLCETGYMVKVCECGTGKYATDCCEANPEEEKVEKEMKDELVKETAQEIKKFEKIEDAKAHEEEKLFEEAKLEAPSED